ncbi:hypothetical protein [Kitasatospora sp. NPDC097691]|uniref:hypothetical protein n=1 Tax=Kitasatospora sp. NPDC097691 TaxID=3157231 RepID=UPI00332048D2
MRRSSGFPPSEPESNGDVNCGVSSVEMRLSVTGPRLIEVNAHIGGDLVAQLVRLVTGIDLAAVAADLAVGREPDLTPTHERAAGARFVCPANSGTVRRAETRPELGGPVWLDRLQWERQPGVDVLLPPRETTPPPDSPRRDLNSTDPADLPPLADLELHIPDYPVMEPEPTPGGAPFGRSRTSTS